VPETLMNRIAPGPISQALAAAAVAARLANRGDVRLAIGLLCQALRLAPEAPLVEKAESWLTVENLRSLDVRPLRRLAFTMARLAAEQPPRNAPDFGRLHNLRAGARVLACGRSCFPIEGRLYVSEAFVRDKLGDVDGTIAVARDAAKQMPCFWSGHQLIAALAAKQSSAVVPLAKAG
jgi:hypothetical protein